jgi:hypothetical protein
MSLLPADVQIPSSTSTHIHLRRKAAASASTSQEDNDQFSTELRDGHTKIPNLELHEVGSRGRSAAKILSTIFFASWVRNCSGGMCISYSVVPKKKEDFDSCRVCRLFSGLAKEVCVQLRRWTR